MDRDQDQDLLDFFKIIYRLKKEVRKGWLIKAGVKNPESVADHVCFTALLSMIIGDMRNLDTFKMVKMALIHDIGEALIGDRVPNEMEGKDRRESEAIFKIFSHLPNSIHRSYLELWNDLVNCKSEESRLVWELDKFEMALQACEYFNEGYDWDKLMEFFTSAERRVKDPFLKTLLVKVKPSPLS
ncbi:MAG: HD domain-containing protein [Nitrososphaerota archaeon]|nr:HD domain-containing protein [Nitrososphaerota archaeon]